MAGSTTHQGFYCPSGSQLLSRSSFNRGGGHRIVVAQCFIINTWCQIIYFPCLTFACWCISSILRQSSLATGATNDSRYPRNSLTDSYFHSFLAENLDDVFFLVLVDWHRPAIDSSQTNAFSGPPQHNILKDANTLK
uniref:Uncharacterized protein n=1 Tax=Triticum urartu TaxID=4572 RepID=A0A8R7U4I2_TRIUA